MATTRFKGFEYNWSFDHRTAGAAHPVGRPQVELRFKSHWRALNDLIGLTEGFTNYFCFSAEDSVTNRVAVSMAFELNDLPSIFAVKTICSEVDTAGLTPEHIGRVTTLRQAIELRESSPLIHGLRAPVSRMVGLVDLLARDPSLSYEAKEYVAYLMKTIGKMRRTVDYLLISSANPSCEDALDLTEATHRNEHHVQWFTQPENLPFCEVLTVLSSLGLYVPSRSSTFQRQTSSIAQTVAWELPEEAASAIDSLTLHAELSKSKTLNTWLVKNPEFAVLIAAGDNKTLVGIRRCLPNCAEEMNEEGLRGAIRN